MATDALPSGIKYFVLDEFKCPCCGKNNIHAEVVSKIDRVRTLMGIPLHINSGSRCAKHNEEIGGKSRSLHLIGCAIDVSTSNMTPDQSHQLLYLLFTEFNGIGIGKTYVHADIRTIRETWIYP